jgi:hypothetical protein
MSKTTATRRFRAPQKGIGGYRSRNIEEELGRASKSVRRWQWEFLRLSKDYWFLCQTLQNGPPRTRDRSLARLYWDFGNIYAYDFNEWWRRKGARIFAEETEPPRVTEILSDYASSAVDREGKILIEVPIVLTKHTSMRQIGKILKRHQSERPSNVLQISTSLYPVNPVRYQLNALQRMHEVWCLHRELIRKPKTLGIKVNPREEKNDLFRIGKLLNLNHEYARPSENEPEMHDRQRKMRIIVSRYLRKANQLIANAERGQFPVFKDWPPVEGRFSKLQLERHAELEEQWWNTDLFSALTTKSAEDAKRIYCSYYRIF